MHSKISKIEHELNQIRYDDEVIKNDVEKLKSELIDKTPDHFNNKDLLRAFVGSLFLGFSAIFSGNLLNISKSLPDSNIPLILLFVILVLTAEIYFIGYSRVPEKSSRPFGQFWIKRLIAFYAVAFFVSLLLAYIFGFQYLVESNTQLANLVLIVSVPCAIGAAFSDLIKKY